MKTLLALDLRDDPMAVLDAALPWIRRLGAVVDVLYVDVWRAELEAHPLPALGGELARVVAETATLLDAALARLPDAHRGRGIVDASTVDDALDRRSGGYALVMVGTHGRTGLAHLWLGSVAERILRRSRASVLVLRPGALPERPDVLWAVDPGEDQDELARAVSSFVARIGGEVDLLTVTPVPAVGSTPEAPWLEPLVAEWCEELRKVQLGRLGRLRERLAPSVAGAIRSELGAPADRIAEAAADHELLVVGTHGREGIPRAVLGSVAERVARTAPCPVLVVKP